MTPTEMIKLPVTTGTTPLCKTLLATFIIVDRLSAYNVVMGRLIFVDLQAVVSIHHLTMKFPTAEGIRHLRGNHRTTRECYNFSISKAKKVGVVSMQAHVEYSTNK